MRSEEISMDAWRRVEEILDSALELSGEERACFLTKATAGDERLRREVEELLRADEEAEEAGFLNRPAEVTWEPLVSRLATVRPADRVSISPDRVGERLGPYEIVAEIGTGGMATVYRARRADGRFEKQVAVKVIRPGLAGERQIRRFVGERQILAELDHPGIARLLDAGATDDGLPYLVMEFVEGEPITEYCDRRTLGVEERLRLFLEVADAVRHAHRKLVLHRDLKPSNILVTEDGKVKLLDFGIAKLLDPATGAGEPTLTRPGFRPLTPEYASPEQIRGEALTTASDVYQLGVLLYRLLAGAMPYRLDGTNARALEKAITETDPVAPSERVTLPDWSVGPSARRKRSRLERLRGELRGDLDSIVLMALRKEPERRFESVEALVADIRRHLEGRPIVARPDRWSYRTKKFLGRHPWLVRAAAAAVLAVGGYVWTLDRHAAALERERNVARAEAARATQMRDFLVDVFEGSDPEETLGDTVTARMLLERGAQRADSVLADQPELRAEMLGVIGRIMTNLGFYERSVPLLERVVKLQREVHGPNDRRVARALVDLGNAHLRERRVSVDYPTAERHFRRAVEIYQQTASTERDSGLIPALRGLGISRAYVSGPKGPAAPVEAALDSARTFLERATEIAAEEHGRDSNVYASLLADQAIVLVNLRKFDEAEGILRDALARLRAIHGSRHPDVAEILSRLASTVALSERKPEAISLFRESLELHTDIYGRGHPKTLKAAQGLAVNLERQGAEAEALNLLRESTAAAADRWPDGHPRLKKLYYGLGQALLRLNGDPSEAEDVLRRAVRMFERELGEGHHRTILTRMALGVALLEQGDPASGPLLERIRLHLAQKPLAERETLGVIRRPMIGVMRRLESRGDSEAVDRWRPLILEGEAWWEIGALERGFPDAGPRLEHTRSELAELAPTERRRMAEPIRRLAERLESLGRADAAARWRSLLSE